MKGYAYDRESLLMFFAAFAVVMFLTTYMMHTDIVVFHFQSALLGAIMIVVAISVFGKMDRMKLVVAGVVVLSLTHISELIYLYLGIGEYANGVIEHSIFFIGILLILQGLLTFRKGQPVKR